MLRGAAAGILLALAATGSAFAAGSGCDAFKWNVSATRDSLAGATATASRDPANPRHGLGAFVLSLTAIAAAAPPVPPAKLPEGEPSAGWTTLTGVPKGRVAVASSGEGWIDLIDGGQPLKAEAFSGAKDCPGIRKVVVFAVSGGPLTLQVVTGSPGEIRLAILAAPIP